mmetsp:Transcript_37457/g.45187  ORF Transcript_37457/g.45187 Transcript_37457/m.45187 type:complete len:170 (+) Transcript_37457:83-592(+)
MTDEDRETKSEVPQSDASYFHASQTTNSHTDTEGDTHTSASYTEASESIDGTSPAVIAQLSELQIDQVSTIMRVYEGRENVLLELLETKALLKANGANEPPPQFGENDTQTIGTDQSHLHSTPHSPVSNVTTTSDIISQQVMKTNDRNGNNNNHVQQNLRPRPLSHAQR